MNAEEARNIKPHRHSEGTWNEGTNMAEAIMSCFDCLREVTAQMAESNSLVPLTQERQKMLVTAVTTTSVMLGQISKTLASLDAKTPTIRDHMAMAIIAGGGNIHEAYKSADEVLEEKEASNAR